MPGSAFAVPPTLASVSQEDRHPVATFSAAEPGFSDAHPIARAREDERGSSGGYVWESQRTRESRDLLYGLGDYEF
jgi:hypothetical protein